MLSLGFAFAQMALNSFFCGGVRWLYGDGPEQASKPFVPELMRAYRISRVVNNSRNDSRELLAVVVAGWTSSMLKTS